MILLIALAFLIFGGVNSALVKYAGSKIYPMDLVFLRSAVASLAILPFVPKNELTKLKKAPKILIISGMMFGFNWILFAYGIQKTTVIMGQLIYVPTTLIVAILGYFFLKEKLSGLQIIGLILSIVSIFYLVLSSVKSSASLSFGSPVGNVLIILGLFSWAAFLLLTRKISANYKPQTIVFLAFLISATLSVPFFVSSLPLDLKLFDLSLTSSILAVGIFSSVIFFFLNQWVVKNSSAFVASMLIYPTTLSAIIYGIIFFNEKLETSLIIGGAVMIIGVFLSTLDTIKKK